MTQRPRKRNCKRMPRRLQYTFPTEHVPSYFQDWLTHRFWGHWGCQCQDQSSFEPHAKPRQNARYLEKTMYETIKQIGQKKTDGQVLPAVPFEELELCGVCARWRGDQTVYPGGSKLWGEIVGEKTMKQFSSDICSREHFFQHMQFDSLRVELLFWWSPLIIPGKPMPDHAWSFANGFGQDSGGVQRCFRIWSPNIFQDWTWFRKNKESFLASTQLQNYRTDWPRQVTRELIKDVEDARKELEIACEPLKMKKSKKSKEGWPR